MLTKPIVFDPHVLMDIYYHDSSGPVQRIEAGGNLSYFVVENEDISNGRKTISLLATGNGQFGGIGNSQWAHAGKLDSP